MAPDGWLVNAPAPICKPAVSRFVAAHSSRDRSGVHAGSWHSPVRSADEYPVPASGSADADEHKYAEDLEEVKRVGSKTASLMDRSDAQTKQAQLWAGVISVTPLNAIWNNVARDTVLDKGLDLVEAARVFALLDVSMNDSILTSHSSKFIYNLWRPYTAIRNADLDLNPGTDKVADWEPLLSTPSYPSYGGNMACVGAGAATALALAFGTNEVPITVVWKGNPNLMPPTPDVEKDFPSFWALAVDEANSRVFGGIHYRFDNDASQIVCPKVSRFAFDNYMQPKNHGRPW